jgi:hypothetical protein
MATEQRVRQLPGRRTPCSRCLRQIVWAVTVAGENGPGGKAMPLDPVEHPEGNTAVLPGAAGRLRARVLQKDERHDPPVEYLAMPHFATCPGKPPALEQLPDGVADLTAHRRRRQESP